MKLIPAKLALNRRTGGDAAALQISDHSDLTFTGYSLGEPMELY